MRFLIKCFITFLILYSSTTYSQTFSVSGIVTDSIGKPIAEAHIHIEEKYAVSEPDGRFSIRAIEKGSYYLAASYIGYITFDTIINVSQNIHLPIKLIPETSSLQEVVISASAIEKSTASKEVVEQTYIQKEFAGSLAKSLEKLPGVNAMEIGAGNSKPIIRGLGLNRVAVAENGIKQEGQQWGADHGLELDALAVENLEVLKGVGAIEYGSDAIGGVIKVDNTKAPEYEGFSGSLTALGKSVNNTIGSSLNLNYKTPKFFYKVKLTGLEYGDYSLPADTINYLNFNIPIYNEKLKNTAGKELDWYTQFGYTGEKFKSLVSVSQVYQKSGFFPGAHGIPSIDRVRPDGSERNIEFPYQRATHFKLINNNSIYFNQASLDILLGYQRNLRQEWSLFHTHYAGQTPPIQNPNLELGFQLDTYDAQFKFNKSFSTEHKSSIGLQLKSQENTIDGFNFLLPKYNSRNIAGFITHEYRPSQKALYSLGMRYDHNHIDISRYYDPILYNYLIGNGQTQEQANAYAERSPEAEKSFDSFNFMAGMLYEFSPKWQLNANAGTNFRIPTAIELGANGIHHGSFRHEQGDINLNPEKGFVADVKVTFEDKDFSVSANPYAYYFTNYIFLKPTGVFSLLPHAGQLFEYTESEALLSGLEIEVQKVFFEKLRTLMIGEVLHNKQITGDASRNYPLPFTPANNLFLETGYRLFKESERLEAVEIYINSRLAMDQNQIAQGEITTPGYALFGMGISGELHFKKFKSNINLQVTNLLNTQYFNHTSFYRRLHIPEMGRNIQLNITIPFGNQA
ncbi:TonB-dependent receptor domain-containing protein [Mesonia sp. K7]|uniref:TonB-dependent receptor n=1 Tax=Mesonia sp. K7 TaxID=2218606 RepID=UPI000DA8899F|nr:TonB-dependent receptor [Mesonia sp. K7]PZD77395.1 TonB-dependent receptor [Mesonia sp. K7]